MQERSLDLARALRPLVVDVGGEPQGVLVPSGERFRFLAVKLPAFAIEGREFETLEAARHAARQAVEDGR